MSFTAIETHTNRSPSSTADRGFGNLHRPPKFRALSTAAFMLLATGALSPAHADSGYIAVASINPTTIEILSNGDEYIGMTNPLASFTANVAVTLNAGVSGKIKKWKAWIKARRGSGFWVQFTDYAYSKSYPYGSRPKTVDTVVPISVTLGGMGAYLTAECNKYATGLISSGTKTKEEIFSQDAVLDVTIMGALSWEMSGIAGGNSIPGEVGTDKILKLVCKATPPSRVPPPVANDPTRNVPDVSQAFLTVMEVSTLNGACNLNLSGVIVTKDGNKQVKFRYKDAAGNQSDIKTVSTDHTKTVNFAHKYALAGTGNKQGKIRIAIVDDNFSSPWADYNVNCNPNAPGGLSQDSGVQTTDITKDAAGDYAPDSNNTGNLPSMGLPGLKARPGIKPPGAGKRIVPQTATPPARPTLKLPGK